MRDSTNSKVVSRAMANIIPTANRATLTDNKETHTRTKATHMAIKPRPDHSQSLRGAATTLKTKSKEAADTVRSLRSRKRF